MVKISSAEFQKNFGRYQDLALTEPVAVTRNGRERIVVLSSQEYHRLKRRDRQVLGIADFTQADIDAIALATAPAEAAQFDNELG
jgi:prevent-host-death family protein